MAIRLVGAGGATSTTVTIPAGHLPGDLIIIFAFRDGSTTNPSVPATFTTLTATLDGTSCSASVGYRVATSNAETSGTWTNATELMCVVLRGALGAGTPVGTGVGTPGTAASVTYGALTVTKPGRSWILGFAGHRNADTSLETPPTNMRLAATNVGASSESAAFYQDEPDANWPSTDVAVGGTAGGWITYMIEAFAEGWKMNNAFNPQCRRGNAGIITVTTEKMR